MPRPAAQGAGRIVHAIFGEDCWDEDGIFGMAKALQAPGSYVDLVAATHRIKSRLDAALHYAALARAMQTESRF